MKHLRSERRGNARTWMAWLVAVLLLVPQPVHAEGETQPPAETTESTSAPQPTASETTPEEVKPEEKPAQPKPVEKEPLKLEVIGASTGANDDSGIKAYVLANQNFLLYFL